MKLFLALFVLVCTVNHFVLNVFAPIAPQVTTRPQVTLVSRGTSRKVPLPTKVPERKYVTYNAIVLLKFFLVFT